MNDADIKTTSDTLLGRRTLVQDLFVSDCWCSSEVKSVVNSFEHVVTYDKRRFGGEVGYFGF